MSAVIDFHMWCYSQQIDSQPVTIDSAAGTSQTVIEKEEEHISQNWFTSKTDKQTLQDRGHRWKQGQWTTEENEILKQNVRFYCQVC